MAARWNDPTLDEPHPWRHAVAAFLLAIALVAVVIVCSAVSL